MSITSVIVIEKICITDFYSLKMLSAVASHI